MDGITRLADGIAAEFRRLLPKQRKTQRHNLSLLVATLLEVRSANLIDLAAGLPRDAGRIDRRDPWSSRVLRKPRIAPDVVMAPLARAVLARLGSDHQPIVLLLEQSKRNERHQVLRLAVRHGDRALPLLWRGAATEGAIGFPVQRDLLEAAARLLPDAAEICLLAERFSGTADLISLCQDQNWDDRLRLKGNLVVRDAKHRITTGQLAPAGLFALENGHLTAKTATTNLGVIHAPEHAEPWIIARPATPGSLKTLEYSARWASEPMVADVKSRGFGVEDSQIQPPDRLARLLLGMALALYTAVSTGQGDAQTNPTPAEKTPEASTQKTSPLKNIGLHQRATLHRPPHPQSPAPATPLENQN